MAFIETREVCKQYGEHWGVDHVSISVDDGCIYGLLGPNGAGKTSLIRIINRITHADSGEVLLHGRPMTDDDVMKIGYLPEERGLYKKMKVEDQIIYLARLRGMTKHDAQTRMKEWLERFDLTQWQDKKVEQLSKGMAQKVQFIATVIHQPPLLIFDEPFSGFDPLNAEILKKEILRLRDEGSAILFSTHNMSSVEEVCQEISLINHAKVVLQGEVGEVRQRFKKNIYRIMVQETSFEPEPALFSIEEQRPSYGGGVTLQIRLAEGVAIRDVITALNEKYTLVGFEEILPSMQEIFIETVGGGEPHP